MIYSRYIYLGLFSLLILPKVTLAHHMECKYEGTLATVKNNLYTVKLHKIIYGDTECEIFFRPTLTLKYKNKKYKNHKLPYLPGDKVEVRHTYILGLNAKHPWSIMNKNGRFF